MKLIDFLVQELPNGGGWREGATEFHRHGDRDREGYFYGEGGGEIGDSLLLPIGTIYRGDGNGETITREQYEAALAASQQPAWNGEGLPPEGIECEVKSGKNLWTLCKVVHSSSAGVAFIYLEEPSRESSSRYIGALDSIPHKHAGSYFRPIRTEAERKHEDVLRKLTEAICGDIPDVGMATAYSYAERAFGAIASGKIPGIRLE